VQVSLAGLWQSTPLVMESVRSAEDPLPDAAAARHPEATWVFIYTREAHPGENVPCHDTMERKLAGARLLREDTGIGRDILVDDLAGTVHRAYGLMPNMTWVIGRGGRVAFKADWTSAPTWRPSWAGFWLPVAVSSPGPRR
jgi:hypothetical protein